MRCSLNIPGHPIIATKMLIKLPSNEMEKTATSDDYKKSFSRYKSTLFAHFPETRVQKLNGSNSKKPKGRYAKLIFSVGKINVLKKTTVNR